MKYDATGRPAILPPTMGQLLDVNDAGVADGYVITYVAADSNYQPKPSGAVTPAALTKTNDTNVTLTLGGTPATALLQAASLTVGWTGTLAAARGGTGTGTYTVGDTLYCNSPNLLAKLGIGSSGDILRVAAGIPAWQAASNLGANPTASVGLAAVNGSAATFLRSDGAPALNQGIAPTWTAIHSFTLNGKNAFTYTGTTSVLTQTYGNSTDYPAHNFYGGGTHAVDVNSSAQRWVYKNANAGASANTIFQVENDAGNALQFVVRSSAGSPANGAFLQMNAGPLDIVAVGALSLSASGSNQITLSTNSGVRETISSAGAFRWHAYGAGALTTDASGNITAVSDERLKRNIRPFVRGLADVLVIEPILYGYTPESGLDQTRDDYVGVSAQAIKQVIPEAVGRMRVEKSRTLKEGRKAELAALTKAALERREDKTKPLSGFEEPKLPDDAYDIEYDQDAALTFSDRAITMALVNAVKELSARVALLEAQLSGKAASLGETRR